MIEAQSLGSRLRLLRKSRNMTQTELGWPELTDSYLSSVEHDDRGVKDSTLRLLAYKLNYPARLLGLEKESGALFHCLAGIYQTERVKPDPAITRETFAFWRAAAGRSHSP